MGMLVKNDRYVDTGLLSSGGTQETKPRILAMVKDPPCFRKSELTNFGSSPKLCVCFTKDEIGCRNTYLFSRSRSKVFQSQLEIYCEIADDVPEMYYN